MAHASTSRALSMSAAAVLLVATLPSVMAGPAREPDSLLTYVPDLGGNLTFAILYTLMDVAYWYHTIKSRKKYLLVLPIATACEALGFWIRIPAREPSLQSSQGVYILWYLLIVLSPAGFLAFNYIVYGRLISAIDPELASKEGLRARSRYSFLPPRLVARIFVISDVCTFLVQAAGGALQTSGGKLSPIGDKIFLVGVTLQGVSYLLFTALTLAAHYRLWITDRNPTYKPTNVVSSPAVRLFACLYISSIGILIRSGYRIAEMALGYGGYLYTTELYTFVLDGLPLVVAMGVFCFIWPHRILVSMAAEAQEKAAALPETPSTTGDGETEQSRVEAGQSEEEKVVESSEGHEEQREGRGA